MENNNTKPYFFFNKLFDDVVLHQFTSESLKLQKDAVSHTVAKEEILERGGIPKRKFKSVGGGNIQNTIYNSEKLTTYLSRTTGLNITPTGERGTYTFYSEANDFLDIHRDINECDLTLITCLHTNVSPKSNHGALYLYVKRCKEKIKSIYEDRFWGYESIHLQKGQSILIQGGIVPHGVNPIAKNNYRIISALCYKKK